MLLDVKAFKIYPLFNSLYSRSHCYNKYLFDVETNEDGDVLIYTIEYDGQDSSVRKLIAHPDFK
jgi:hypothetical protein